MEVYILNPRHKYIKYKKKSFLQAKVFMGSSLMLIKIFVI